MFLSDVLRKSRVQIHLFEVRVGGELKATLELPHDEIGSGELPHHRAWLRASLQAGFATVHNSVKVTEILGPHLKSYSQRIHELQRECNILLEKEKKRILRVVQAFEEAHELIFDFNIDASPREDGTLFFEVLECTFTPKGSERGVIALWDMKQNIWFEDKPDRTAVTPPFSGEQWGAFLEEISQSQWEIDSQGQWEIDAELPEFLEKDPPETEESDDSYRDRICDVIPEGAWYTAEDLRDASGKDLDTLGEAHGVKRRGV
jgi:hypothetical protein